MDINRKILELGEAIYPEIVEIRHELHRHPELSEKEFNTAERVEKALSQWGIEYKRNPHGTAVIAYIKGKGEGKCVGLRGDMDALPIQELGNLPYKSEVDGVMHACGHDIHTASLLGTAYVLSQISDMFTGTVKLCFQPGEEKGRGYEELVEMGMLEDPPVDAYLAAHTCPDTPVGYIHVKEGPAMSASSQFSVTFTGSGGHAATPHLCGDTIVALSKFVLEVQSIVSRRINPIEPVVITVGKVQSGVRSNIMPKTAYIEGTIRTPKRETHTVVHEYMRQCIKSINLSTGTEGEISFIMGFDSIINDAELVEAFVNELRPLLGTDKVIKPGTLFLASDNFFRFTENAPSVYFRVGVRRPDDKTIFALHSPEFYAEDGALLTSILALSRGAVTFLK